MMMVAEVQDTPVPEEVLPLIVLHRFARDYYGGNLTILEMRRFLEPRLKSGLWRKSSVKKWIWDAMWWCFDWDAEDPEYISRLLEEYFSVRSVA
jgi:hypothetical protein